jgi:type I restriction enzyme S subunit
LSFEGRNDVPLVPLNTIACYSKGRIAATELNTQNYVGVDNLLPNKQGKMDSNYVPSKGTFTEYKIDDILIGNIRPYLKKVWKSDRIGGTNGDVLVLHVENNELSPDFLYFILSSYTFFSYNMQHAKGGKMPRGSKDAVLRYSIPFPPLQEQIHISSVLNHF